MVVMEKMLQASGSGPAHSAKSIMIQRTQLRGGVPRWLSQAVFSGGEECRHNGTGGRKAAHLPKPKDTVPKDQLALEKAVTHAVQEDGNKTRVQLANVEESIHGRMDELHNDVQDIQKSNEE